MKSYSFVYGTNIKKICEEVPFIKRKIFPGVTLPALVNLSKCLYEKQLIPLPERKTALAHALSAGQVKCLLEEKLASLER